MSKLNKQTKIGICVFLVLFVCMGLVISVSNQKLASNQDSKYQTIKNTEVGVDVDMSAFPKEAQLSVEPISNKTEKGNIIEILEKKNKDNENIAAIGIYDISVSDKDGKELQPDKDVKISFQNKYFGNKNLKSKVFHMKETKDGLKAEKLKGKEKKGKFTAATDGFSYYVVEFTYNDLQYVMEGDTEIPLSDVLDYVGLVGEVSDVEGSNDELFSFEKKNDKWYVAANKAFDTTEWMRVTIDGITYNIVVTDAAYYGALKVVINGDGNAARYNGTTPLYDIQTSTSTSTNVTASVTLPTASDFTLANGLTLVGFSVGTSKTTADYSPGATCSMSIRCNKSSESAAQSSPHTTVYLYPVLKVGSTISGTYRNVNWSIDTSGTLNLGRAGTTQTFSYKATESASSWPWYSGYNKVIESVKFVGTVKGNGSMCGMFHYCKNLTDITYLYRFEITSDVTDTTSMFFWCDMTTLDLSDWDTSNVTSMNSMFDNCYSLTNLNISGWNTSSVTNMGSMFSDCEKLTTLDVSSFNTSNVTNMSSMFYACRGLTNLDVSNFDTSNVTNMERMFYSCNSLTNLDLSNFNTSSVTNMSEMFRGCSDTTTIYVDGNKWDTSAVTTSSNMFTNCTNLVGGQGTTYDSNYVDKTRAKIDGGTSDPGYLTKATEAFAEFDSSTGVLRIFRDDKGKYTNGQTSGTKTYWTGIEDITGNTQPKWYVKRASVTSVVIEDTFSPKSAYDLFYGMTNLTSITGLNKLDTSNVTDMRYMFGSCTVLTSLDVSNLDTSNVTDMSNMFSSCNALTSLDLSNFDTSNVTNMSNMFRTCNSLTSLDVSSFNTSSVTDMQSMFSICDDLTSLDVSSFNTSNVTNMSNMFSNCRALTRIYASDTWDTSSVTSSSSMFVGCTNLVGGKGTTYDSSIVDKTRAKIDGGTSDPGYLTAAPEMYAEFDSSTGVLRIFEDAGGKYTNGQTSGTKTYYAGIEDITSETQPKWYDIRTSVTSVVIEDTFKPKTAYQMFYGMVRLTSIRGMENLDTSNVTNMSWMFSGCPLKKLNLTYFDTSNVTNMSYMFYYCGNLTTIYVDSTKWDTSSVTTSNSMFTSCSNLVGGQGTTYNSSYTDKARAKIDGGTSDPGYLTQGPPEMYAEFDSSTGVLRIFEDTEGKYTNGQTSGTKTYYAGIEDITGKTTPKWFGKSASSVVIEDTFSPKTAYYMFEGMRNLTSITGISNLDTSNVTNMDYMFYNCYNLTSLDLSNFNTSNVTTMSYMFCDCYDLASLDVSGFDTSNVTKMNDMFHSCSSLTRIYASDTWDTSSVTSSSYMFSDCTNLVGGKGTTFDSNYIDKTRAKIDGGTSDPGYFTAAEAYAEFDSSTGVLRIFRDDKGKYTNGQTSGTKTYWTGIEDITGNSNPKWYAKRASVTNVVIEDTFSPKTAYYLFYGMENLTSITGLNKLDTSNVTNMSHMFESCSGLTSLDLSDFDTSNVTNISYMFNSCNALTSLDLSNFNTSNVTNMSYMFAHCSSLTRIYASDTWDTSNVTVTSSAFMFSDCTSLVGGKGTTFDSNYINKTRAKIDGGTSDPGYLTQATEMYAEFDSSTGVLRIFRDDKGKYTDGQTSGTKKYYAGIEDITGNTDPKWYSERGQVTSLVIEDEFKPKTAYHLFFNFRYIESVTGLDKIDVSDVTNMEGLFYNWGYGTAIGASVKTLDLSNWDTSNVTNMDDMFARIYDLTTIYVDSSKWDTSNVTSSTGMFDNCPNLVGGKGTTYDSSYTDKTRAHVDGGTSNPGYLSEIVSEYTLTANPNGGTLVGSEFGTDAGTTNNHDFTVVPDTTDNNKIGTASRTGYTFDGWYTAASGGNKVFSNTGTAVQGDYWTNSGSLAKWQGTDDLTVYAHWTAKTYTLTANPNGGTLSGTNFGNWNGTSDTATITGNGDNGTSNIALTYDSTNYSVLGTATKTGHSFSGWYTSPSGGTKVYNANGQAVEGSYWASNKYKNDGNLTVYAQFSPITYTISYAGLDSASGFPTSGTFDSSVSIPNPEKNGYSFAGWNISGMDSCTHTIGNTTTTNTSVNGTKATTFMNLRSSSGTVTFTATWTTFKATLKYHANGGTTESGTYKVGTDSIMENASGTDYTTEVFTTDTYKDLYNVVSTFGLTKTGYHIDSTTAWNTLANGNGVNLNENNTSAGQTNAVTTTRINGGTQITEDKSVTVYANWKANTYTVQYNANGGSGTAPASQSFTYGQSKNLQSNTFTTPSSAWTFNGWNTKSDGTGTNYTETQSVSNLTAEDGATVTLYAMWTKEVTFYSGIDKATTKTANQVYGANGVIVPNGTATINGWTFEGWREDINADVTSLYAKTGKINPSSVILYAVYSRELTLKYTAGGGTGTAPTDTIKTQVYNTSNVISTPSFTLAANTFTRTGYDFAGWDVGQPGTAYTSWVPTVNDAVVTKETEALWNGKPYTVTFDPNGGSFRNSTSNTSLEVVFGSNQNYNPGIAEKSDAGFLGWYTSNGTMVFDASGICVSGAYWTASGSAGKWNRTDNLTVHAEWLATNGTRVMFAVGKSSDSAPAAGSTSQGGTQYGMPSNVKGEGSQYALFDGINSVKTGYRYHTRSLAFDGDIRSYHYIDTNGNVMRVQ